jgi:hypothetical protein
MQSRLLETVSQDSIVVSFVQIVGNQLACEWTRKKIPNGLYEAYVCAEADEGESTNGIMLKASFRVWFAYWLASSGKHHFLGRSSQLQIFDWFNKLPYEKKQSAAEALTTVAPHSTVNDAIGRILAKWETLHRKSRQPFFIVSLRCC